MASEPVIPGKSPTRQTPPKGPTPGTGIPVTSEARPKPTRSGVVWVAVVTALVLLLLLIIFILQNQEPARVMFLGLQGTLSLGMALFIASVAGGILVAVAGAARIIRLRSNARKHRVLRKQG
ncbi:MULTISPECIES: lipopolysaccharide assembly LapA domain-containing protein [Arthrobacter]|uniref:LapA family protein n=1 Tax=Arthrobacter TaxID=1663 RepID=UPI001F1B42E4|nr:MULTISPECIES: lipopolysaccharide assembly protein LapA domain-containing protein [Arthrobacter]